MCHFLVSILILLDVVLEDPTIHQKLLADLGFNPYSVGCCSGSTIVSPTGVLLSGFNPYSVGCCSGSISAEAEAQNLTLFQSLFCWMLFWKLPKCSGAVIGCFVSILILLDVVLEARRRQIRL